MVRQDGAVAEQLTRSGPWQLPPNTTAPLIALVRHGRTAWNAEGRFLGRTDIPLDDVGSEQATALASWLPGPLAGVYSSSLARAVQTASRIHPEPMLHDELQELWQGDLEGMRVAEGVARHPGFFAAWAIDPTDVVVPGGESLGACRDRALGVLERISEAHPPDELVVVVTHQLVIASVVCTLAGKPLNRWRKHGVRNAAVSLLVRADEQWQILAEDLRYDDSESSSGEGPRDV